MWGLGEIMSSEDRRRSKNMSASRHWLNAQQSGRYVCMNLPMPEHRWLISILSRPFCQGPVSPSHPETTIKVHLRSPKCAQNN